jgi:D-amino-acid oxidase
MRTSDHGGSRNPDVLVIGAGVSGLTTAVCLAEAGARVAVQAGEPPSQTTSAVAGAIWGPHLVGLDDRVSRWSQITLDQLYELAEKNQQDELGEGEPGQDEGKPGRREPGEEAPDPGEPGRNESRPGQPAPSRQPGTGIRLISGRQVAGPGGVPQEMVSALAGVRPCEGSDLPAGYTSGWRYTAPVIAMPAYLGYLTRRLTHADGTLETGITFGSLSGATASTTAKVLVNCTGADAHGFARDPSVVPVRGQAVVVANPGLTEFFIGMGRHGAPDGDDLVYVFPHESTVVLGGTHDTGNWSREPDPATAARILADCAEAVPALRNAQVIAHTVGLRPTRPLVRLEAVDLGGGRTLVHNYGHGGAGVTLSWGCALDAAALALAALG